ncbi:methylmalonyl-CoA mutase family protein [Mariniflexile sp.]|uniref:methylmalonyl-CoA mutase family protein n=1 Tax=Mariniflexile sp. TaxID=1979402 RepID=UPI00356326F7
MARKNLQHIVLKSESGERISTVPETFTTSEGITIKSNYSKRDIANLRHLNFAAGIPPYLRGSYSTMYLQHPWTICEHIALLKTDRKELSTHLDFEIPYNQNRDNKVLVFDFEKSDLNIITVEDMTLLLDQFAFDNSSVSIPLNSTTLPLMAFFIVAAEEKGIKLEQLSGTFQLNVFKVLMAQETDSAYQKLLEDILKFNTQYIPKFNGITISGYQLQEAGATCDIELAYTLAFGLESIKKGIKSGLDIDSIAPRLSFCFGVGMNHFMEIAKMRTARMLWTKLVKQFNPKNENSSILRMHCQTTELLKKENSHNTITRGTIETASAILGGTQYLHTTVLNTNNSLAPHGVKSSTTHVQSYLLEETNITKTVDPWAGSFYLEKLTHDLAEKVWGLLEEIEALGGISKAIEAGVPQSRIKDASEKESIIEANSYKSQEKDSFLSSKTDIQSEQLQLIKAERNLEKVNRALLKINGYSLSEKSDVLTLVIEAARERATIDEIREALDIISK